MIRHPHHRHYVPYRAEPILLPVDVLLAQETRASFADTLGDVGR